MKTIVKAVTIIGLFAATLMLPGCGVIKDYVSNEVNDKATKEIQNSEEYQTYEQYREEGILTEEGVYPKPDSDVPSETTQNTKSVKITISNNSFLDCLFYTDEETKTPLSTKNLYLDPGESLFVADVTVNNNISNLYDFSCFRIWSYDEEGERSNEPYAEVSNKNGLLLKIPDDYSGAGFSVEPIGSYTDRHISANAYYLNDGKKMNLPNGQWQVNGESFNEVTDISPVDSYTIVYDYSTYRDDYYFVKSNPNCWYSKESNHTVIFREVSSNEEETEFAVEMHPYITMTVINSCLGFTSDWFLIGDHGEGIIQSIKKGNESLEQGHIGESTFEINKLKVGDTISIRVGKEYKINGVGVSVGTAVPLGSDAENGYEYTVIVPDTRNGISIEITERNSKSEGTFQGYNMANADITIKRSNGTILKNGDELPGDNEKVTMTITPHEGYYINGFNDNKNCSYVKKNVKFSKLEEDILDILDEHQSIKFISLNLTFSDEAGTYNYKLDGKNVTESPLLNVRIGQKLEVDYKANDGYSITYGWPWQKIVSDASNLAGREDSIKKTIEVSAEMDGKTVDRETFGIIVEKEG